MLLLFTLFLLKEPVFTNGALVNVELFAEATIFLFVFLGLFNGDEPNFDPFDVVSPNNAAAAGVDPIEPTIYY